MTEKDFRRMEVLFSEVDQFLRRFELEEALGVIDEFISGLTYARSRAELAIKAKKLEQKDPMRVEHQPTYDLLVRGRLLI